jgi:hypothetical protein
VFFLDTFFSKKRIRKMSIPKFNGDRAKWAAFSRNLKNVWALRKVSGVAHGTEPLPPVLINNGSV